MNLQRQARTAHFLTASPGANATTPEPWVSLHPRVGDQLCQRLTSPASVAGIRMGSLRQSAGAQTSYINTKLT